MEKSVARMMMDGIAMRRVVRKRAQKKRETEVGLSKKLTYKVYLSAAKKSRGR